MFEVPAVPGMTEQRWLHVVDHYKHLGSITGLNRGLHHDGRHKEQNALSAYAPLSSRVFGSATLNESLQTSLGNSLVSSRLLFNAQIVVPDVQYVR
eukprot:3464719-Karenia_brevis.AAC.1